MTSESLPSFGVQCGEVIWNGGISIQRRPIVIQDNVSLFSKLSSQLSAHAFFDDAIRTANAVTIRARFAVATSNDHQDCCCECKAYAEPLPAWCESERRKHRRCFHHQQVLHYPVVIPIIIGVAASPLATPAGKFIGNNTTFSSFSTCSAGLRRPSCHRCGHTGPLQSAHG